MYVCRHVLVVCFQGPSRPATAPTVNRFASVCGHFFFPLMSRFDTRIPTMDLLGSDR